MVVVLMHVSVSVTHENSHGMAIGKVMEDMSLGSEVLVIMHSL